MTKNDISIMVAKATGLQQNEVKQVLQLLLDGIVEILVRRKRLELRGFGVFEVHYRHPRQGRNPMTGESVNVPGRKTIRFQAGKYMQERINDEIGPGLPDADGSRQRMLKFLIASLDGAAESPLDELDDAPRLLRRRKRFGPARRGRPPHALLRDMDPEEIGIEHRQSGAADDEYLGYPYEEEVDALETSEPAPAGDERLGYPPAEEFGESGAAKEFGTFGQAGASAYPTPAAEAASMADAKPIRKPLSGEVPIDHDP